GDRRVRMQTVRGTLAEAKKKRRELMSLVDKGTHVDRSKLTVAEWLSQRLDGAKVAGKTLERYRELPRYITDQFGQVQLQQLKPAQLEAFYRNLQSSGGKNGAPLSAKTVRHVHRLLNKELRAAVRLHVIPGNPLVNVEKITVPPSPA